MHILQIVQAKLYILWHDLIGLIKRRAQMAWVESAPKLRKFGNSRVGSVAPINHQSLVSAVLATWHIQLEKQGAKYDSAPAYVASRQVRGHPLLSATHQAVERTISQKWRSDNLRRERNLAWKI